MATKNNQKLMNHKQVYEYLGGCIGRDKVYQLMKSGVIRSAWLGGKLVADADAVKSFAANIFVQPNGTIDSIPVVSQLDNKKAPNLAIAGLSRNIDDESLQN